MSTTPLFDSIARRSDRPAQTDPVHTRSTATPAPTSPISAPVDARESMLVPAALVQAIEEIPARMTAAMPTGHVVCAEQLVLVEVVADAITRAVIDAVALELEQIARDGVVRV